jgi:lysophospholipase L1-like esterase
MTSSAGRWLARAGLAVSVFAGGGAVQAVDSAAAQAHTEAAAQAHTQAAARAHTEAAAQAHTEAAAQAHTQAAAQAHTQAAAPAHTAAATIRVMPLGDSLTAGVGSSTGAGYRAALHAELTRAGVTVDFVGSRRSGPGPDADNEGHPGWRIDNLTDNVEQWLAAAKPDVVLLDIGTNDLTRKFDAEIAPAKTADLIDRITRELPDVRVVVAKLLVVGYAAAAFRRYNATLAGVVAARGPRVSLADMSRIPVANTGDGVHPTDAGYRQMAYQWYRALGPVLAGGRPWRSIADPFPMPSVLLAHSAPSVRRGAEVTLTARLSARLTSADLGRVPVRLRFRRAGTSRWVSLGTARTDSAGTVRFARRTRGTGYFAVTVLAGRAKGRHSGPVKVAIR